MSAPVRAPSRGLRAWPLALVVLFAGVLMGMAHVASSGSDGAAQPQPTLSYSANILIIRAGYELNNEAAPRHPGMPYTINGEPGDGLYNNSPKDNLGWRVRTITRGQYTTKPAVHVEFRAGQGHRRAFCRTTKVYPRRLLG